MYVVIIAAAVIAVVDGAGERRIVKNAARFAVFAAVFFAVLLAADGVLSSNGITNQSILSGNLKYKIAVGLNSETTGTWSAADAELIFDEKKCGEAIAERLENTAEIVPLVIKKTAYQFGSFVYTWSMNGNTLPDEIYRRLSSSVMARPSFSMICSRYFIAFSIIFFFLLFIFLKTLARCRAVFRSPQGFIFGISTPGIFSRSGSLLAKLYPLATRGETRFRLLL